LPELTFSCYRRITLLTNNTISRPERVSSLSINWGVMKKSGY
jgi:hypothetical protein